MIAPEERSAARRIVQYRMIMKRHRFPIQDDHERRLSGAGILRSDADTHAEQRDPNSATDQRFFSGAPGKKLQRTKAAARVSLGAETAGGAGRPRPNTQ